MDKKITISIEKKRLLQCIENIFKQWWSVNYKREFKINWIYWNYTYNNKTLELHIIKKPETKCWAEIYLYIKRIFK